MATIVTLKDLVDDHKLITFGPHYLVQLLNSNGNKLRATLTSDYIFTYERNASENEIAGWEWPASLSALVTRVNKYRNPNNNTKNSRNGWSSVWYEDPSSGSLSKMEDLRDMGVKLKTKIAAMEDIEPKGERESGE